MPTGGAWHGLLPRGRIVPACGCLGVAISRWMIHESGALAWQRLSSVPPVNDGYDGGHWFRAPRGCRCALAFSLPAAGVLSVQFLCDGPHWATELWLRNSGKIARSADGGWCLGSGICVPTEPSLAAR